ncbi:hypothetical protein JCM11251_001218 [Rhodosporidiobolus azoricus]
MPVGHERINAREPDPNHYITFIRSLEGLPDSEKALKILKAIAAQFKPIMKEWGFGVNSLVEHEWNPTFAGRNWNGGEVIELVLRRRDGSFAPYQFILYVMAHELAHCKEMNHSVYFRRVNQQIRTALSSLRSQGYTGDGFWSTGNVLHPDYANAEIPLSEADEPVYTCGGANKKRGQWKRRRSTPAPGTSKAKGSAVKLGTTGRQTAIAPKAGARVKRKGVFDGEGNVLSADPEMSTKGRRSQAKGAVAARAAAAEARLAAEQRAKAAEARVRNGAVPSPDSKKNIKPDPALDFDWEGENADLGGWETDEEDKPHVKLEEDEKAWLAEDMREFRESQAGGSGSGKGKGKGNEREVRNEPTRKRRQPSVSPSPGGSSSRKRDSKIPSSTASSASIKRKQPRSPPPPDDDLDLTPAERAWLMADLNGGVKKEESDDEVKIIESGAGGSKKARVAYMPMPEFMGGQGEKGKGKGKANVDSDDDLPDPSSILSPPKPPAAAAAKKTASSSASIAVADKRSPSFKKEKHVHFLRDEEVDDELESEEEPRRPSSPQKRPPMKFFSTGSKSLQYAKPGMSVSSSSRDHHRAVHPPDLEDDDDEEEVVVRPSGSDTNSKKRPSDAPPAKKRRKERSDKGKKRGPRTKKDDDGADASSRKRVSSSPSPGDDEIKQKPGRRANESVTIREKEKKALAAKRRADTLALLAEIDEDEKKEKGDKVGAAEQEEEDELEWMSDDEPAAKKAEAVLKEWKRDVKGKGKAKVVDDDPKQLVTVDLELRAGGPSSATGSACIGGPIKPFSTLSTASSSSSSSTSISKNKINFRPPPLLFTHPSSEATLSASDSLSSDSSRASPTTPPPGFKSFFDLSSSQQDRLIAKLEVDNAHNERLRARRATAAEEEEKRLLEAASSVARSKARIAARAQVIEQDAAMRGETMELPRGRAGGWGGNVFSEGKATEKAVKAGAVDPVARTQLESFLGVVLGGEGSATGASSGAQAVLSEVEGNNAAALPECEMCSIGARSEALQWSKADGNRTGPL